MLDASSICAWYTIGRQMASYGQNADNCQSAESCAHARESLAAAINVTGGFKKQLIKFINAHGAGLTAIQRTGLWLPTVAAFPRVVPPRKRGQARAATQWHPQREPLPLVGGAAGIHLCLSMRVVIHSQALMSASGQAGFSTYSIWLQDFSAHSLCCQLAWKTGHGLERVYLHLQV